MRRESAMVLEEMNRVRSHCSARCCRYALFMVDYLSPWPWVIVMLNTNPPMPETMAETINTQSTIYEITNPQSYCSEHN